ncbi:MAG: oligopeptide transporter, OPT family [Candidatus Aminicenantes bacterium]|nr:oligopeptide transporter, OPT family [Candidatus Aminicenantes bacterium]
MEQEKKSKGLPENAYRKLKPGEEYKPVVPADAPLPEITLYSVTWGIVYVVLFSMASAYLGLKIGQVFEAAIPIAILAVGFSSMLKRKNALSENVIIQSIGGSSGLIVAGAIFTIPGLYILGIEASFMQVFLASLLGGFLGVLFLIPFRKYFVKDMHGEFPFPEATAINEVLVTGEEGGKKAKILLKALAVGGIYNFMIEGFGLWKAKISTIMFGWGKFVADKVRLEFNFLTGAAVMGLGYIVGLKFALIIACGSFLSWWVFIPAIYYIGQFNPEPILNAAKPLAEMMPQEIFIAYVQPIGIGGIAAAGIIGVIKSRKIIFGAFKLAARELFGKSNGSEAIEKPDRLQKDIPMKWNMILIFATLLGVFAFFLIGVVKGNWLYALAGLAIVLFISFLLTTVSARAIAIVGTNPVSGMTLMTLIVSSIILVSIGLKGENGILVALLIGGVVCTALSMAGGFITDLKIGYWLGTTPASQEKLKFLGILLSAASVGFVIFMLHKTFGFGPGSILEAPQASAMAAVIKPLMTGQSAPWMLYMAGVVVAIILEFVGVPPLAFALGMYLPLYLNSPLLAGGLIAHFVAKSTKDEKLQAARKERGTLIASGFIAGGALMGVVAAFIAFVGKELLKYGSDWTLAKALGTDSWEQGKVTLFGFLDSEILGVIMFAMLLFYFLWDSKRAKID